MDRIELYPMFRMYADRAEAGKRLATALAAYEGTNALVLGIPRGGVPVAAAVAAAIGGELDVVVARKLGAPGHDELALGAVTANGGLFLNRDVIAEIGVTDDYLNAVIARESAEARRREERFRGRKPAAPVEGRTAIVIDDGLATGATMRAAVQSVRKRHPAKLVVAVPVGSEEACAALRQEADEVVCLMTPDPFWAVGLYYEDFAPVEDDDVQRLLQEFRATTAPAATSVVASV